jgi:hypothetical protein
LKRIPVTAIGKRNLSLARILYIRQQSLSGVGNCHWHAKKILGTSLCGVGNSLCWLGKWSLWSLGYEGSPLAQGKVCGLQAGLGRSGNFRRAKKNPLFFLFHYKNSGSKVHTMSYSVLTALFGVI